MNLEPMIAHGSRMSWAGILRTGDGFTTAIKSQLAVITAEADIPLCRYFGKWNVKYSRFTTNFTSSKIKVNTVAPGKEPDNGIRCILHWVDQKDLMRSGKGSVSYGDGWPEDLWGLFTSELEELPEGTIAEKLRSFLDSDFKEENEIVSLWRKRLKTGTLVKSDEQQKLDKFWLPVPATLIVDNVKTQCIFSWSPSAAFYHSLSEALSSSGESEKEPDYQNQAKYYLECSLAKLHGVNFYSPDDFIEDEEYANRAEVKELQSTFTQLEKEKISDRRFGRLDRFGFPEREFKTESF